MTVSDFDFRASQDLLAKLQARVIALETNNAAARAWVPQLISSSTQPTNTGAIVGTYVRTGNWVTARFQTKLAGWAGGTGAYAIRAPWVPAIPVAGVNQIVGQWWAQHSASFYTGAMLSVSSGTPNTDFWLTDVNGGANIGATTPWTWATNDVISGWFSMEVGAGY